MRKKIAILLVLLISVQAIVRSKEIKILSWNIFMVPPIIFKSCQQERAYLIAAYIKNQNADVVVLEETFMKSTRKIIQDNVRDTFPYFSKITKRGVLKNNSGVWIMSKFPIQNQHFLKYRNRKGSDIFSKKGAVFVEVEIENKKIQLIATHTQSLKKFEKTRQKQFGQLKRELADVFFNDSVPQLIIGDLNCDYYDTTAYEQMIKTFDVLPPTYFGEPYSCDGLTNDLGYTFFDSTRETLDYILLRREHQNIASVQPIEILHPKMEKYFCKKPFLHLSDHNPIITNLELK